MGMDKKPDITDDIPLIGRVSPRQREDPGSILGPGHFSLYWYLII